MKIKNILIANRGEIAVRIIKTAKKMGIKTTVIKTSAEPSAMYLNDADNADKCRSSDNYEHRVCSGCRSVL